MKMDFYKLSGLLAFMIAWAGMLTAIFTQGKDKTKSISLHAASSKKTIMLLAVLSPISMTLFMIFAAKYVAPLLGLSTMFIILNILADAGYILGAWIPATGGVKTRLHNFFSYGASLLLIPVTIMLATAPYASLVSRLISYIALLIMVVILVIMSRNKRVLPNYLYYQIAYFLAFDISLLAAAYIR